MSILHVAFLIFYVIFIISSCDVYRNLQWETCSKRKKYTLGSKRPPLLGAKRTFTPQFCQLIGILPPWQTCDFCGNGYLKINIYAWHGNASNLFTNINRIFVQYTWYNSGNLRAMLWNMALNRGVRRSWAYRPALCYCHISQQTAGHTLIFTHLLIMIIMDMFISLRIWPRKAFISKCQFHFY